MRRALAPVDQARAGRVVVVGELLPVGDRGRGELVSLHLLLLNIQVSAHLKVGSSSQMAV